MDSDQPIDIGLLRQSCGRCSLQQLCLAGGGMSQADVEQLDRLVKRRRPLKRGEALYRAGSMLEALFVAREGAFKTTSLTEQGDEQVIGFHLPGELIGLDGLGAGSHRCTSTALESAEVCEVPLADLEQVAAQIPALQHQLLRVMGQSVGRDQEHMQMLGRRHATERVALFLHSLSERLHALSRPHLEFHLAMSREEIASYLGLVIETVSRTFSRMQEEGVIEVKGRRIRVRDAARLARLVHEGDERRSTRAS
ncbi:helix-turn-helix domain-containing protein [Pseudomarimonas salicorniae]|uniref:CRP-like protein Clp n=1 Tax=Pseudomarimonas salicorniae TaxID=2933270 RepID=A0ABT0GFN3_9GAMM|nr:helix-turn-helix domain-containing protein [Lysobacter sp. CAU 1642]MCK7593349.1 helix-turn-helix domain-containing protein [Lysobacter sp. CAU 1642]